MQTIQSISIGKSIGKSPGKRWNLDMQFEWDDEKAASNLSKHKVTFEEAKTVFEDPLYIDFYDPDHSEDEDRYLIVGQSSRGKLLIVSYTERRDAIRIISAREVTRMERAAYEGGSVKD